MRAFAITGIVTASWIPLIISGIRHARDAAVAADVRRHALERHHRAGAGRLRDPRLLGRDHVHDHAALEHLGQAGLDGERRLVAHRGWNIAPARATLPAG